MEKNRRTIEGKHEDYTFIEGPAPVGAKCFGFDASGQFDAKIECIAYSATIPNPVRGIDIRGNYWCAQAASAGQNCARGISKEQAIALGNGTLRDEIHCEVVRQCKRTIGSRGGEHVSIVRVRPSGRCQTWKTRPNEFRLPVKFGLYESSAITQNNCDSFHLASNCSAMSASQD